MIVLDCLNLLNFIVFDKKNIPVVFFNERENVGDSLNRDLFKHFSNKNIKNIRGIKHIKHILAVGSVLGAMNKNSIVWGSGLISDDMIDNVKNIGDIRALRGHLTKEKIENKFNIKLDVPLGDPALLMPKIYKGVKDKKYKFGFVPHYVDENHKLIDIVIDMGGHIIKVDLPVEKFINELTSCEYIISSSMHGLILADAYGIPNVRVHLSNLIYGGDFKFNDYLSTTDCENSVKVLIDENPSFRQVEDALKLSRYNAYLYDLDLLLKSFPLTN